MKKIKFAVIILLIGGMIMSYTRVNWQNAPSTATPVNAENLNTMDKGIADAHSQLAEMANEHMFNTDKLTTFKSKLGTTLNDKLNIVCIGDSITQGGASSAYGWTSWNGRLRQLLQMKLGSAGYGFETVYNYATLGTGWSLAEEGVNLSVAVGSAEASGRLSMPFIGTKIELLYTKKPDGGTANVYIDSVNKGTIDCSGETASYGNRIEYTGYTQGSHTIEIEAVGKTYIDGLIVHENDNGIFAHQVGHSGKQASEYFDHPDWIGASINKFNPALTIIALGVNDYFAQSPLATYEEAMQQLIDNAKLTGDVLILAYGIDDSTGIIPYSEYYDVMVELAKLNDCAFIDIYSKWHKSSQWATDNGLTTNQNVHPNDLGHLDIANTINEALNIDYAFGVLKYYQGILEVNPVTKVQFKKGVELLSYMVAKDIIGVQDAGGYWQSYIDKQGTIYSKTGVRTDDYVYGKKTVGVNDGTTGWLVSLREDQTIHLKPRASAPPTAAEGRIYFNSTDKKFYGFDGTSWTALN